MKVDGRRLDPRVVRRATVVDEAAVHDTALALGKEAIHRATRLCCLLGKLALERARHRRAGVNHPSWKGQLVRIAATHQDHLQPALMKSGDDRVGSVVGTVASEQTAPGQADRAARVAEALGDLIDAGDRLEGRRIARREALALTKHAQRRALHVRPLIATVDILGVREDKRIGEVVRIVAVRKIVPRGAWRELDARRVASGSGGKCDSVLHGETLFSIKFREKNKNKQPCPPYANASSPPLPSTTPPRRSRTERRPRWRW